MLNRVDALKGDAYMPPRNRTAEEWLEADMGLGTIDPEFEHLPMAWRVSTIRGILTGKIKDHIDLKDAERGTGHGNTYKGSEEVCGNEETRIQGHREEESQGT